MKSVRLLWMIVAVAVTVALFLSGCGKQADSTATAGSGLKVVTTMYPVYEFAKQVAGDKAEVSMLIPPGAEPHDWEPSPKDLARIKTAKLFLYQSAGVEPVDKLLKPDVLGDAKAVEVSRGIPLIEGPAEEEEADGQEAEHADKDAHHEHMDVHVWLDPVAAQQEVDTVVQALSEADPQNKAYYEQNGEKFKAELQALDQEYRTTLANVSSRDIVTSHAAFGYLAKRYNLQQVAIMGLSPDSEPTPEKMANVVQFCREHNVKYIFFETIVSPKLAQTISKETGAGLLVLNPVESLGEDELKQGKNYLTVMRENLVNLKKALQE